MSDIDFSSIGGKPVADPIDFSAIGGKQVAASPAAAPPEKPGFFARLGQSVGVPTSMEELKAAGKDYAHDLLPNLATAGMYGAVKSTAGYVKNAYQGAKEAGQQAIETGEQLGRGEISPMQAVGKGGDAALHGTLAAIPFVGKPMETAGQDIHEGNYAGAVGGLTGVIGQVAAPELLGRAGAVFKSKPPLSRALGLPSETGTVATGHIKAAAADMGLDLSKATAGDVLEATKAAKQNILKTAQASLPEGSTLADLPKKDFAQVQTDIGHLNDVQDALTKAQEEAANAKPGAPSTRGAAAVQTVKGLGKVAVSDLIGRAIPGGKLAADVVGMSKGAPDIVQGVRGMVKPQLTPEMLDSRLQGALTSNVPHTGEIAVPQASPEATATRPAYQPLQGNLRVPPFGEEFGPPAHEGGDLQPITPAPEATIDSERGTYQPLSASERAVQPTGEKLGPPAVEGGDLEPVSANGQPAKQPAEAKPGTGTGAVIQPYDKLTLHGAKDGETAALMQLAHTGGQTLRQIAQARGLKVPMSADNTAVIQAIHDDLSPEEVSHFAEAAKTQNAARASSVANVDPAVVADNKAIAAKLYDEADAMQARGESPYRIKAWRAGAESIEARPTAVRDIAHDPEQLQQIKGVSKGMAQHIQEAVQGKDFTHTGDGQPETQQASTQIERRQPQNAATRQNIDEMSPEDMKAEVQRLRDSEDTLKHTDPATGLRNKLGLVADQAKSPAKSLAAIDLDGLKPVNDHLGHPSGDKFIRETTNILKEHGVQLYRTGGDEFFARSDLSPAELDKQLQSASDEMHAHQFDFDSMDGKQVTVHNLGFSHGVGTEWRPGVEPGEFSVRDAEQALAAKKAQHTDLGFKDPAGRNFGRNVTVVQRPGNQVGQSSAPPEVTSPIPDNITAADLKAARESLGPKATVSAIVKEAQRMKKAQ